MAYKPQILEVAAGGTGRATLTNHGVLVGATTTAVTQLSVGTNGQVLIGATGADPAFATLSSSDSSITFTPGANTLSLQVSGGTSVGKTITGDSGGALSPTGGNWNILGSGSTTTSGAASTLTVALTGLTNHAILVGAGTATITKLGLGTAGQVLQSGGAGADPAFSTPTYPSASGSAGKILISDGTNNVYSTPTYPNTSGSAGKVVISDGTNNVYSTPTFPNASATVRKIIVSDGTNWVASTETYATPGTSGNLLTSDGTNWTSAAPAASSDSYTIQCATLQSPLGLTDGATYIMQLGQQFAGASTSANSATRFYIPKAGTITKIYGSFTITDTLGSNENGTLSIRLNDTSDTTVSSTVQLTAAVVPFNNTSLSISVSAGDFIGFKFVSPTWVTNPRAVGLSCTVLIT